MKTEREKFEEWYTKTNQSNINDSCWCIGGFYTDRVVQRSWEAWQAAKADAVPEGFVVVPREPTINKVKAMTDYALGEDAKGFEVGILCGEAKDIYKAMIEAGEKK